MNPVGKRTVWIERKRGTIALRAVDGNTYILDIREIPHLLMELSNALVGVAWRR